MAYRRGSLEAADALDSEKAGKMYGEPGTLGEHARGKQFSITEHDVDLVHADQNKLHRRLKGRHMQMIAIGGAIGAGLFVGTSSTYPNGGPGSVLIGFIVVGITILAVMYPINGAFTMYICRFVDPSWGFACGWQYGINWLTVLPFEISAACNIIHYWNGSLSINNSAWIVPLLFLLIVIQFFGVRGYGEVEFALSMLKIIACVGFMILGIIIDVGGVPTDDRGYIGVRYWQAPYKPFLNGFHGFCSIFVTAAFAYNGTELTGLAAAEAENPRKEIPRASKQVVWRIFIFYIVNLFLVGLIVPATSPMFDNPGGESRRSPFVIAIQLAGIKVLPSIFNAVILISVMSVANSCTFGSTRTFQALAEHGMGPKIFAYIDRKGRPLVVVALQLVFGLLAFINLAPDGGTIFTWLLALSGLASFFIFGSICVAHIRFRMAWKLAGHSVDEIPYRASCGVIGSYICAFMNLIFLIAQFYIALYPISGTSLSAENFFQAYLAAPFLLLLYCIWKGYSWSRFPSHRSMWTKLKDIDLYTGMREGQLAMISGPDVSEDQRRASVAELQNEKPKGAMGYAKAVFRSVI